MKELFVNSDLPKKLAACLNILSPSCKQVAKLQSQSLIQPLSRSERFGLRMHLFICAWCRRFGEQLRFLQSAAHQCPEKQQADGFPSLSMEGRERIKRAMQAGRSGDCRQAKIATAAPEIHETDTCMTHGDGNLMFK